MCRQAIDAALGEVFAALLACMRVSIAVVIELRSANEVFKNEGVRLAAHCASRATTARSELAASRTKISVTQIRLNSGQRALQWMGVQGRAAPGRKGGMLRCLQRGTDSARADRQNSSHRL